MRPGINSVFDATYTRLADALVQAGHRVTETRRAVLWALAARPDGFTIEDLCGSVRPVGRATVYRTVRLLVDRGLVCKLALRDTAPWYSLALAGHHHHAVCVQCGTVVDFRQCRVDDILQRIETATGGQVLSHRLEVYLLCSACHSRELAETVPLG